jgi:RNase P subunit RPR2
MTNPDEKPRHCLKCKASLGNGLSSIVYLSEERDPLRAIPLCHRCAILACFRCGKAGIA